MGAREDLCSRDHLLSLSGLITALRGGVTHLGHPTHSFFVFVFLICLPRTHVAVDNEENCNACSCLMVADVEFGGHFVVRGVFR